jgi:phosphoserine phosphatase
MLLFDSSYSSLKPPMNIFESIYQSELMKSLLEQEQRFGESHLGGKSRIALFDLDNTLLVGDIGNAVFAQLLSENVPLSLPWSEYRQMLMDDPSTAYREAVRTLNGLSLDYLIQATKRVLSLRSDIITSRGVEVPVPRANQIMVEVIHLLRQWEYTIFVISASNDISAKVAASTLFDIPVNNIAGIKPKIVNGIITSHILNPIPVGDGKVAQYRLLSGDCMPMIVATDSETDLPLLHMCDPDGVAILVGENESLYETAKLELPLTVHIHRIPGMNVSFLQEQHYVA